MKISLYSLVVLAVMVVLASVVNAQDSVRGGTTAFDNVVPQERRAHGRHLSSKADSSGKGSGKGSDSSGKGSGKGSEKSPKSDDSRRGRRLSKSESSSAKSAKSDGSSGKGSGSGSAKSAKSDSSSGKGSRRE